MIETYLWQGNRVTDTGSDYASGIPSGPRTWVWVDAVDEGPEGIRDLGEVFDLNPGAVEETLAATTLPHVEEHLGSIFIVLHGLTAGSDGRLEAPEMDVFIGERFLITIRDGERAQVEQAKQTLTAEGGLPVSSPAELIGYLVLSAGRRYGALIPELERQVDSLEEMAFRGDPQTAAAGHALRRDVIYVRRALGPQFDMIEDLSESTHPAINEEARLVFTRVASQQRRALESLESGRALLGTILETYRGAVADQTNEIMRLLTVFSAILLPLSLIAGLWGMNFNDIPGAGEPGGFWILLGVMAVLAAGVWVYFARRGFIGAPRLRDLPRAVGLGLVNLSTAPIRAVAGTVKPRQRTDDSGD